MRAVTLCSFAIAVLVTLSLAQHGKKPSTIEGEIVCLSCYLTHGAKGENHSKCAGACINKGLPMGILTKDGKLLVALEDHANANAYQQLKKFAAKTVTVTGTVASRSGITGIAVQKVSSAKVAKALRRNQLKSSMFVQWVASRHKTNPETAPSAE